MQDINNLIMIKNKHIYNNIKKLSNYFCLFCYFNKGLCFWRVRYDQLKTENCESNCNVEF